MNTPRERNINFITAEDKAHAIESADENTKSFLMDMLSQFSMLSEQGNVIIMKGILLGFETCSQVSYGQDLPDWAARSIYLMRRLVLNLERPS